MKKNIFKFGGVGFSYPEPAANRAVRLLFFCVMFFVMLFCFNVRSARGVEIIVAASGEREDFQAAVDEAAGLSEPAVILLGPGEWELFGSVTAEVDNLTILGAGANKTLIYRDHEDPATFLRIQNAQGVRVSSIGFRGSTDPGSDTLEVGVRVSDVIDFRIDHCSFEFLGNSGVMTRGDSRGVIDHCAFDNIYKTAIGNYGYGVSIYGVGEYEQEPFGSERATFIEDSFLAECRHATASNSGARYVIRHSHVTATVVSHAIDAHGNEYNSTDTGTEWIDVNHVLIDSPVYTTNAIRVRGGLGVIWSNAVYGYNNAVSLTENTPQETGPVYIWDNTLGAGTALVNTGSGAESVLSAPSDYVPYRYPHPLVDDLIAAGGPDVRYFIEQGGDVADVFLDGKGSSASEGHVAEWRWFREQELISDCAVDIVELTPGMHLVLLEVERNDGLIEHDMAIVEVIESSAIISEPSWANIWFVPLVGEGSLEFNVTPAESQMDGYIAITGRWSVSSHEDNAAILRMNNQGYFDARDGDVYAGDRSIPYEAGVNYEVRFDLDISEQKYSVTVNGELLADGYSFRLPAPVLGQVTAWHSTGGLTAQGFSFTGERAEPDPACAPDAGLPDGGVDGGVNGGVDGDVQTPDAGMYADAGEDSQDNGGKGCGCKTVARSSGEGTNPLMLLLILFLFMIFHHFKTRRPWNQAVLHSRR